MGVLGGQKCKSHENLPSGCTDWHQICYTSADSSGNGHRLKTISPSIFQGAFWGVLGGHKTQKSGKSIPNGCTDWHQIWYTFADSSRNGHRLKTISPSIHQGSFGGGVYGSKIQKSGKSTKRLDRLAPYLVHVCRFIWEWT